MNYYCILKREDRDDAATCAETADNWQRVEIMFVKCIAVKLEKIKAKDSSSVTDELIDLVHPSVFKQTVKTAMFVSLSLKK